MGYIFVCYTSFLFTQEFKVGFFSPNFNVLRVVIGLFCSWIRHYLQIYAIFQVPYCVSALELNMLFQWPYGKSRLLGEIQHQVSKNQRCWSKYCLKNLLSLHHLAGLSLLLEHEISSKDLLGFSPLPQGYASILPVTLCAIIRFSWQITGSNIPHIPRFKTLTMTSN